MKVRGNAIVVTDADGNPGGSWLACGPGPLGATLVLFVALGAISSIVGVVKKTRLLVLLGVGLVAAAVVLNYVGPIA